MKKHRGRPKCSKNKPKIDFFAGDTGNAQDNIIVVCFQDVFTFHEAWEHLHRRKKVMLAEFLGWVKSKYGAPLHGRA